MPEWRRDPIVDRWVVVAPERRRRPSDFQVTPQVRKPGRCPLCPGHEPDTPPEVLAYGAPDRAPDTPGWRLRVVPNKFPAVQDLPPVNTNQGLYQRMTGLGRHEMVIETPEHVSNLDGQTPEQVSEVLRAWEMRLADLERDPRWGYVQIFKNMGRAAGASLEHSHSQIIAIPFVPVEITREMEGLAGYQRSTGRCALCDMVVQELGDGQRLIWAEKHFVAFTPFASRAPGEVWIVPRDHEPRFGPFEPARRRELAETLLAVLRGLARALNAPPYNLVLHTSPLRGSNTGQFHWHFEIIPRLSITAGFELGTGYYINPLAPEEAAKWLQNGIQQNEIQLEEE